MLESTPAETARAADHRSRDASSLMILGSFFTVLSLLVMAGIFWTYGDFRAVIVTLICGGLLFAVGIGMIAISRRLRAKKNP